MELNLRKARALEAKIQNHLDGAKVNTTTTIRVQGTFEEAIANREEARKVFLAEFPVREELLRIRYAIRRGIEEKNESLGINALINQVVLIDAKVKDMQQNSINPGVEGLQFEDQFKYAVAQFNAPADAYNRNKTLSYGMPVCKKEDSEAVILRNRALAKQKESLQDKIGEKNIIGKVTLAVDEVKLLESLGLV